MPKRSEILKEDEFDRAKSVFFALDVDASGTLEKEEVINIFGGDPNGVFGGLGDKPIDINEWIEFTETVKTAKGTAGISFLLHRYNWGSM